MFTLACIKPVSTERFYSGTAIQFKMFYPLFSIAVISKLNMIRLKLFRVKLFHHVFYGHPIVGTVLTLANVYDETLTNYRL